MTELPQLILHSWHYVHPCPSSPVFLGMTVLLCFLCMFLLAVPIFLVLMFTNALIIFLVFLGMSVLIVVRCVFLLVFPLFLVLLFILS